MIQGTQGEEAPTIELNPDIAYEDPELQALYKQQFPEKQETTEPDPIDQVDEEEEVEDKKEDSKEVKEPKPATPKKEEEKELTPEEQNAKAVEFLQSELPEPFQPYIKEYFDNEGKLSEDSLAKIKEEHGFDSAMVETFIKTTADNYTLKAETIKTQSEAQAAKAQQDAEALFVDLQKQVGGEDAWKDMVEWAATEAPEDVVNDYNELVDHEDPKVVRMAVKALKAAYDDAQPKTPKYLKTQETVRPAPEHPPFVSQAEMDKAYQDPRYNKDMDYTNKIHARTEASLGRL